MIGEDFLELLLGIGDISSVGIVYSIFKVIIFIGMEPFHTNQGDWSVIPHSGS